MSVEQVMELLRRYDRPGPRYTSYPTAVEFNEGYDEAEYRRRLALANREADKPLSLYVHLPFCSQRCTFCGCNVVISRKHDISANYLDYLHREIDLLAEQLPERRRVSQYHWGGGTPTYQTVAEMRALHGKLTSHFQLEPDAEVALEVDPRVTTREQMEALREMGFNRLSMGVQDFTPDVQAAVNRNQSEEQTRVLYEMARAMGFHSVNMDLIYGLPRQTPESFARAIDTLLGMRPDRVAVYSFALVPWIKAQQKYIDPRELPAPETKLRLFCIAREKFLTAGYVAIGMDHFALPEDELARAIENRTLHRNFMGYTVKMGADMVGLGVSAIGDVAGSFAQNVKKLSQYYAALEGGRFPIERGYSLDEDDKLRRDVITRLMCTFHLDIPEIEERHRIHFQRYFAQDLAALAAPDGPVAHGFLEIHRDRLEVVGDGRLFVRNVCMAFDRYLRAKNLEKPTFSRTI
ncbi:MAG TPA: oxygen-independent coproporphyrinogen III oxidase [Candidatus Polarisedimenticolaceae bacterium]|nr:oxygen-independent coproporphyrinogen III oxidase [Candidatus Polarisedimenticolaceae bacterium]